MDVIFVDWIVKNESTTSTNGAHTPPSRVCGLERKGWWWAPCRSSRLDVDGWGRDAKKNKCFFCATLFAFFFSAKNKRVSIERVLDFSPPPTTAPQRRSLLARVVWCRVLTRVCSPPPGQGLVGRSDVLRQRGDRCESVTLSRFLAFCFMFFRRAELFERGVGGWRSAGRQALLWPKAHLPTE